MNDQEMRDGLRMLKRPTVIERLKETLPFPKGSVPKNGLPFWERIPLASKLPIIEHPKDAFVLYRDKVGKKLWRQSPMNTFRLDDPFCLDVSYDYDPLHDANLAHIYKSRHRRKVLRRQGLISRRDEAVCTLHQFNTYRRYLQCIYRDTLKLEYERMVEDQSDEIALNKARECAEKAMQVAKMREERDTISLKSRQYLEEEQAEKVARLRDRQRYFDERIENHEVQKAEARRRRVSESRKYEAGVRYRNAVADEIRRAKVAAVRQKWRLGDRERSRHQKEQQEHLKALKEKEVNDRWQEKREFQEQRLERENKLLEQAEEERRLATELHMRKMETEHLRMQVLFQKVKAAYEKERRNALKTNTFRYIYVNDRPDDSVAGRVASSAAISSRRTTSSTLPPHRKAEPSSGARNDDSAEPDLMQSHYRRKLAMCIQAMEDASMYKKRPFDLWNLIRFGRKEDKERGNECDNGNENCEGDEDDEEEGEDPESPGVQIDTAIDALLTNVVQGYVHHRVMHTLKEVYHEALDQCHWLVEREERRQAMRYGMVCYHALRRDKTLSGSVKHMGYNPFCALCCRGRYKRKAKFNPEKTMRKIEAYKKRAQRYRTMLEEGVDFESDTSDVKKYFDDEEGTDGGRLDKNFEDLSINLRRRIILLSSQSVDERFKKFTAHRWKILKEVDLSVLMERLCNMMLLYDSKEFLPSAEFQWAADILARDVMKEVRAQIRSERRDAAIEKREKHAEGMKKSLRERPPKKAQCVLPSPKETTTCVCQEVEQLDTQEVPLLRLHSRSPHQPSLPSIIVDEV